jgi:16S rRNA (cytidine1402-2'-O)-methyltransferase
VSEPTAAPRRLTLIPTPIGNLADITLRAIEVLREADLIAAEDTRHSRRLLEHHGIATPVTRLDTHTVAARAPALLDATPHLAYISDAGTPGISDPGADLVRLALARGHRVEALPGATALIPALVLSGLATARFAFEGFLPRKGGERRDRVAAIARREATTVLYESPRRLAATLADLATACGPERPAAVLRELTKRFESAYRGSVAELAERFAGEVVKGEVVVVIQGAPPSPARDYASEAAILARHGLSGRALREALIELGAPRNLAYELALGEG